MSTVSDNDDAPQPNHALVASLLPTIRPPKALETPDGHTKRSTAQLVIGKTLSLCLMAGILGAVYAFGELTSGPPLSSERNPVAATPPTNELPHREGGAFRNW